MIFNGVDVLIAPDQYLSGPCLSFEHSGVWHLLRNEEEGNRLKILVWRQSPTVHLYTFRYNLGDPAVTNESVLFFVDIFTVRQPYFIAFLTLRNTTPEPIMDLSLKFLLDFTVGGIQHFDENYGEFHPEDWVVTQTAPKYPMIGFGSPARPSHWQVSDAKKLCPLEGRSHLNDQAVCGPGDCAVGLEWDFRRVEQWQDSFVPIIVAGGRDYQEFIANYRDGVEQARRITNRVIYSIHHPSRMTLTQPHGTPHKSE